MNPRGEMAGKRISLSGFSCFHAHFSSDGAAQITLGIRFHPLNPPVQLPCSPAQYPGRLKGVIVIDAGGDTRRSIFGELMVTYCRKRGIAGIVVDGSLRDVDAMSQLTDFPVYARGITPDGPYKNGPGEINTPIVCGGRLVNPGYIVIGDEDGVIFVNPSDAPELLEKVNKLHENEIRIINTIEKDGTYIRPWVNEKLESLEVERINYVEY